MNELKHTPEPWHAAGDEVFNAENGIITDCGYSHLAWQQDEANAARIVACVNACTGMENPKEEIEKLKEQNCKMLDVLHHLIEHTTVEFAERNGFGPQRMKASEVYDEVKWGKASAIENNNTITS